MCYNQSIRMIERFAMYGYKIRINSLPRIVWACETTVDDYQWENRNSGDMLEISFSKFGRKTVTVNGGQHCLEGRELACVVGREKRESSCQPGEPITIVTVAVKLEKFEKEAVQFGEVDYRDNSVLLLPAVHSGVTLDEELVLMKLLHSMIRHSSARSASANSAFISDFFKLLHKIDTIVRNAGFCKGTYDSNYYVKKTDYLIESGYARKLTLKQVASELSISPVYLSAVYKANTGVTFSDQLLKVRMRHAESLLLSQSIPTAKVAGLCGFCDESYFRKQFKKFFGMNVKEYRNIKNGITLYHAKPLRKPDR